MAYQSTTYSQGGSNYEGCDNGTTLTKNGEPAFGVDSGITNNAYFCFKNVRIPKGATIVSAVISWVAAANFTSRTTPLTFKAADADSASPPADHAAWVAQAWMGTVVNATITADWTGGTRLDSPDIASLISAAVNRAGWAIGNNIMIGAFNNGGANNTGRRVESNADANNCPILTVVFQSDTFYVNYCLVQADLGYWDVGNSYGNGIWMGRFGGRQLCSFRRYLSVPVPQGTQILSAQEFINVSSATDFSTLVNAVYCNDADDAVSPTTWQTGEALALTTATIDQTPGNVGAAYTPITYPEITTCVQEVLDRVGWAEGNDLIVINKRKSGADGPFTSFAAFVTNNYYKAYLPRLEMTFSPPAAGGGLKTMMSLF